MKEGLATAIAYGVLLVGAAVWAWIVARLVRGRSVVAWQRRRSVPWHGFHVLAIVWLYLMLLGLMPLAVGKLAGNPRPAATPGEKVLSVPAEKPDSPAGADQQTRAVDNANLGKAQPAPQDAHGILQLLSRRHDLLALLVCVVSAAVTAPLCEEFLFRLVLQGWLEAREWRGWRAWHTAKAARPTWLPFGLISVVLVAVLFGAIHYRPHREAAESTELLMSTFFGASLAHVLTIFLGMALLRFDARATAVDLGWDRQRLSRDIVLGLSAFVAMAVIVYPIQLFLSTRVSQPDIFSLTIFGLGLGVLYCRTHRIVPSIILHVALNTTTLLMAALFAGG